MQKNDFIKVTVIGALVGVLVQPILSNVSAHGERFGVRLAIFFAFTLIAPLALFVVHLADRRRGGLYQFAQFAAVGTLNSFIDLGVLNLETSLYGTSLIGNGLFAAFKAISFLFATTNSFFWNKYWTFSDGDRAKATQVGSFYGIAIVGWVLNVGAATLMKSLGGGGSARGAKIMVDVVAPLVGIAVSFAWNFVGYKYFVFKKKELS